MASPHVAGAAALVLAANPTLTNVEIRSILQHTAENLGLKQKHEGYGLVRVDLAVQRASKVTREPVPILIQIRNLVLLSQCLVSIIR